MHPDKVPEPFREVQKLKVLELQLSLEIARVALEHQDWNIVDETTIRSREDPVVAQIHLSQLLHQISTESKDDTVASLQQSTKCKADDIPIPICYVARKLGGKKMPSQTVLLAFRALMESELRELQPLCISNFIQIASMVP